MMPLKGTHRCLEHEDLLSGRIHTIYNLKFNWDKVPIDMQN
jgi:hypothetical protein